MSVFLVFNRCNKEGVVSPEPMAIDLSDVKMLGRDVDASSRAKQVLLHMKHLPDDFNPDPDYHQCLRVKECLEGKGVLATFKRIINKSLKKTSRKNPKSPQLGFIKLQNALIHPNETIVIPSDNIYAVTPPLSEDGSGVRIYLQENDHHTFVVANSPSDVIRKMAAQGHTFIRIGEKPVMS